MPSHPRPSPCPLVSAPGHGRTKHAADADDDAVTRDELEAARRGGAAAGAGFAAPSGRVPALGVSQLRSMAGFGVTTNVDLAVGGHVDAYYPSLKKDDKIALNMHLVGAGPSWAPPWAHWPWRIIVARALPALDMARPPSYRPGCS